MKMVDVKTLAELKPGDTIRGKSSGRTWVVVANYGSHVTAVAVQDVTNPGEWEVLRPSANQLRTPMSNAFSKLLDKRPAALIGYEIGRAKSQRNQWLESARKTDFPEVRAACVREARERNRELIRHLRAL